MKKFFSTILLTIFTLNFCYLTNASYCTPDTSYFNDIKIYTKEQLKEFANAVNAGGIEKYAQVTLESDLTITEEDNWIPIGSELNPFKGRFNGNFHKIELYAKFSSKYNGLFGVAKKATITNLNLENSIIRGSYYVAALVGFGEDLNFVNCSCKGCFIYGECYLASFLAEGYGTFNNCYSDSSIFKLPESQFTIPFFRGAFIGYSTKRSFFKNCINRCCNLDNPLVPSIYNIPYNMRYYSYLDFCSNDYAAEIIKCYKGTLEICSNYYS